MENKTVDLLTVTDEIRTAVLRWYRFSNEVMSNSIRLSQPLMDVYVKGLSNGLSTITNMASNTCKIPETECPPYCVCTMDWDTCEGNTVTGTIDIENTGKQATNFVMVADNLRSSADDSNVKPQLSPGTFTLEPGTKQTVVVNINVGNKFNPGDLYESEVKVRGRYEQCVRLRLTVQPNLKPHCDVNHGEIPRRIVAHHWYDHFQCEELCFEPIRRQVDVGKPVVDNVPSHVITPTTENTK